MKGYMTVIEIYTDGSCSGNPGPGGWAAVAVDTSTNKIVDVTCGREDYTTNNRMEMSAILHALAYYGNNIPPVIVHSDSAYAVNTFTQWMWSWKNNGWKRAKGQPIENLDLVKTYVDLCEQGNQIDLRKVDGHKGIKWNEIADGLATGRLKEEDVIKTYG